MEILTNHPIAPYTSLNVGGLAEKAVFVSNPSEVVEAIQHSDENFSILGYGCNIAVSDKGLAGTTIFYRSGTMSLVDDELTVDAGVWWDDVVAYAIQNNLWGLELMSEIPSSVGGAVYGNIAAYGQQVSDSLAWLLVYDTKTKEVSKRPAQTFTFSYRASSLQSSKNLVILQAGFKLSKTPLHELAYDSALAVAEELQLDHKTLAHCRDIIIETRRRAGSIFHYNDDTFDHTAGSFFKNPLVSTEQAEKLAAYDETGKTLERILNQAKIHGGSTHRASAAHVMLAAGFKRGDTWGNVRIHPSHVLKLQTLPGASAQELYDVCQIIQATVHDKLGIDLETEVKFIGDF